MVAHHPDLSRAVWRKSSRSSSQGQNCVEVAHLGGVLAVRDSKDPDGGGLLVSRAEWVALIHGLKQSWPGRYES